MTLELSTEEKIIVTILWVFTIFFLVLVSGIFDFTEITIGEYEDLINSSKEG